MFYIYCIRPLSDFYAISPYEVDLQKPTVLRIAIPDSFVADDLKDQHLHIGKVNNTTGDIDPLGGTIITVNNIPYLQSELSELGIYAAFKSDSLFQVDSVNADMITCQPRIFSPAVPRVVQLRFFISYI